MATVRFALVGVCYISEKTCSVVWSSSPQGYVGEGMFPVHVCVEPVVAGTQSCQNHLAGPVNKKCVMLYVFRLMFHVIYDNKYVDGFDYLSRCCIYI